MRRFVIRPFGRNQHFGVAQHIKQCTPSHGDAFTLQRLFQHVLELARAHAPSLALAALAMRLTAYAYESASLAHTQSLDESLLQGLPEGFFTTRTP